MIRIRVFEHLAGSQLVYHEKIITKLFLARVDPGFFLAGGAPLTNAATDGWHKQVLKVNKVMKA